MATADVLDADATARIIASHDGVISAIAPRRLDERADATTVQRRITQQERELTRVMLQICRSSALSLNGLIRRTYPLREEARRKG
jgi:putative NADH-flavin reductase